MKTQRTKVEGTMYVFAQAKSEYELSKLKPGELPFKYKLKSYDYGDESCVRLHEFPVSSYIPDGIDITLKCVENLKEQIVALEKETAEKVAELNERIKALALIEYRPEQADDVAATQE